MGIFADVAGLWRKPQSLLTAAAVATSAATPAPTIAEGVPGGGNISGRLQFEPTADLRDASGYGRAGSYDVGQWQQILLSNPFVSMALDHVLRPIADARVDVEPVPESVIGSGAGRITAADAKMHADFVAWALTERFQLSRLSKVAAQGFLLSGFSLFEPVAEETFCPMVPGRTVWALKDAPQRLPNSLDPSQPWPVAEDGRLVGIGQLGPTGMGGRWQRSVLPEERALLFSWKRAAGNFAGESQLRTCWYFAAKAMPMLAKMVPVSLQKEGPGIPQATAIDKDAKLTPAQRDDLIALYANMVAHESAGMVMPAGWKTEWTFSPDSNKGHILDIYERMGMYILQQFGAQQLMLGTGNTGSRSVGQVHDARSMAMVVEVLGFLVDVYNGARGEADGLVKRLIQWNFGPQPAYPKVKLTAQRPEMEPKDLAEAAKTAKDAGLFTSTLKDENNFRERAGFSPLTEEELAKERADAAARAPKFVPGVMPGQPPPGTEVETPKEATTEPADAEKQEALKASMPRAPWTPSRPLRASEAKVKLGDIDAFFTGKRDEFDRRMKPVVMLALAKAAPAISSAMADRKVLPAEIAAVPLDTARIAQVVGAYMAEVRKAGGDFARGELAHQPLTAAAEEDEKDDVGKSAAQVAREEADEVLQAQQDALVRRMEARLRGELEREAVDALRTGGDAAEVVDRIASRQIDSGAFRADAGSITTKVFNVGRDEAARIMGGVASVEYSAILDSATCEPCQSMDGETADFGSPEHDAMLPPNRDCAGGDNCRCLLTFIPGTPPDDGEDA